MNILEHISEFKRKILLDGGDESTAKEYASWMTMFMAFHSARFQSPAHIPVREIENYILHLCNQEYSPSSINQFIASAKRFYGFLGQPQKCANLEYHNNPPKTPTVLTYQECIKMCEAKVNPKHSVIINLLYYGALRRRELRNLKIEHISKDRRITIVNSKYGKSRVIVVPEKVIVLMRKYYVEAKPVEYLLNGEMKKPQYSFKSIENVVKNIAVLCGIKKKVSPHLMRHSRATHLLDNGASTGYVSDFLGHSDIRTTHDFYHTLTTKAMMEQFDIIDEKLRVA